MPKAIALTVGVLALAAVVLVAYLSLGWPPRKRPALNVFGDYDRETMRDAMAPTAVGARQQAILDCGSRYIGQEGFEDVQALIRRAYHDAGLEVYEQRVDTVAPETTRREILDAAGEPLAAVEIYPFMPNQFQPIVTPDEGVSGTLIRVTDEVLRTRTTFDDCIALVDASDLPAGLGVDWRPYARLGFRAVILSHPDGLDKIGWSRSGVQWMVANVPTNYPRLAATPEIFGHQGETVRLHVRSRYVNAPNINFIGILRAGGVAGDTAEEALVISARYDAASWLPDRAPGTIQAINLAAQLSMLDALADARDELRRDVIFVATGSGSMGHAGAARLLSMLGGRAHPDEALGQQRQRLEENEGCLAMLEEILACFDDEAFIVDAATTKAALAGLDRGTEAFLDEQFRYILNTLLLSRKEPYLARRLAFLRTGEDTDSEAFRRFQEAQDAYNEALMIVGYPVEKVLVEYEDLAREVDLRRRCRERFAYLADYHREHAERAAQGVDLNRRFQRYRGLVVCTPLLAPDLSRSGAADAEEISFYMGDRKSHQITGPAVNDLLAFIAEQAGSSDALRYFSQTPRHNAVMPTKLGGVLSDLKYWSFAGYAAFQLMHTNRVESYQQWASPIDLPAARDLTSMDASLRMLGEAVLSIAYGNGRFDGAKAYAPRTYRGRVLVGGLGRSIVPNYPLADALVATKADHNINSDGRVRQLFFWTDPYGRYSFPSICAKDEITPPSQENQLGYCPVAVGYDDRGRIRFIRDEGPSGQKAYRSMGLHWLKDIGTANIVVFRATAVTVLDRVNPQTFKDYDAVILMNRDRLTPAEKFAFFKGDAVCRFIEPDLFFYVAFKAGTPENPLVHETRAFMLGEPPDETAPDTGDIAGEGYLAADTPFVLDVPRRIAESMALVNGRRLAMQNRHRMADARTNDFHAKALDLQAQAADPSRPQFERLLDARDAVAYHALNHPVLRENITEAVISILWYLCLLVPFTFFFEKLLFAFPDVRKQLAAHTVIFVLSFALLKLLHPAFGMIRSSLMILLGFVIMLISGGITVLFSGKFQENLEGLRAKRGAVAAAEVNRLGVVGTAFMLGLNNMHRRKVRTGLTCGTLALITFAMICFTTTTSDVVDSEVAMGEAAYPGLLAKDERMKAIEDGELQAIRTRFGHAYEVAARSMVVARQGPDRDLLLPEITVEYQPDGGAKRSIRIDSLMTFEPNEPLADQVRVVTDRGWFAPQTQAELAAMDATPVMLPTTAADQLGISPDAVDGGRVIVRINGRPFHVHSLFDPASLARVRDLDGEDILPFDAESMREVHVDANRFIYADKPYSPLSPESIVLARTIAGLSMGEGIVNRRVSIAVWLRDKETGQALPYKEAREQIDRYLEQSGRETYYGLAGVAYLGKRARERTIAGMVDMLIPLVIAALTVLNTIRGSVYERRDEIAVYNAVGIAPRYVFFMFFAEAFVYAVVGAVLGYFLSQGVGLTLTTLGWTGGLNMTFTSFSTVLASLAIMAAVFASTLFPALQAMQIAAPAEEAGWTLPEPEGDTLSIALPFTFDHDDRLAILEFFNRFFLDHGEGSSGAFFCDGPQLGVSDDLDRLTGQYVPELSLTVWLKPYDLGVSQKLIIDMPTDPKTGEYVAHLTLVRLSGTRKSWMRLNKHFLSRVRKHFLHWRAVGELQRREMFVEARDLMTTQLTRRGVLDAS